jgi:membrane peptidoglycan carboxypeptidase
VDQAGSTPPTGDEQHSAEQAGQPTPENTLETTLENTPESATENQPVDELATQPSPTAEDSQTTPPATPKETEAEVTLAQLADTPPAHAIATPPSRRFVSTPRPLDSVLSDEADAMPVPFVSHRLTPLEQQRMQAETRRWARRRRRYTLFVRRSARARQAARSATFARAAWATVIVLLMLIFASLTTTFGAATAYYNSESGLIHGLQRQVANKDSVRIYDDKGTLLYQIDTDGAQHSISLADVPVDVVNATIAIEDHDFWTNQGVSFVSIVRAAQADLQHGQITQGGSTITQQLIKQQVLSSDVNFTRKLDEAILAIGMTENGTYSKRQILEMYLNSIPYSPTAYGIDAAATEYFGYQDDPTTGMTAAQHLDLAQASMLAGVPQNPNDNDPLLNLDQAYSRQATVLNDMVSYGYISQAQANAAWTESHQPHFFHPVTAEPNLAPHFVYYIRDILDQMITSGQLRNVSRSGLNVYTTLDLDMQNAAQKAINDHLYGTDRGGYAPFLYIRDSNLTNAAVLIADQHNGDIKVMLGSANYYSTKINGKFNVVTQGYRGPGSSFKPFVYATAFEKGWFPAMTINDSPTAFWDPGSGTAYKPLDFDPTEVTGLDTLRTALDWSLNIPAVKVMQFAGVDNVRMMTERMGITDAKGTWGLSSALGALGITPFEMVQAYTVFANYGEFIPLHGIDYITDSTGNVLYKYVTPTPVQVMDPRVAFLMTSILSDNASRAGDFGPCSPLYLDPKFNLNDINNAECGGLYANHFLSRNAWPTAAKTGTGQNFTDDWTMGYTMDYTGGVWAGNSNNTPMIGIDGITGAAPIFFHSMIAAEELNNKPKTPFPVPTGVQYKHYCSNGVCTSDWFLAGYNPPANLGEKGGSIPCVALDPNGGWNFSSSCQISQISKLGHDIGAPPPINTPEGLAVGALPPG